MARIEVKRTGGTRVGRASGVAPKPRGSNVEDESTASSPRAAQDVETGSRTLSGRAATRIVAEAAKVLEEELAAGIVAARHVEERFINVDQIRARDPDEVMQRFRSDAHEIVDIVLDVLTVAVDSATTIAERSFSLSGSRTVRRSGQSSPRHLNQGMPTLSSPTPLVPGQTMEIAISVENESDEPTQHVVFKSSDLQASEGAVIEASNVECTPNDIVLQPHSTQRVTIRVHVPETTEPGTYCGMFQATNLSAVRAVLVLEVQEPK